MAGARIERVSSLFRRVDGLYKGKALTKEELPIWYEVYKAFPPHLEPTLSRAKPTGNVRNLIYVEDFIKSDFLKRYKSTGLPLNMLDEQSGQGKSHIERYVKYFVEFSMLHEDLKAEEITTKVEQAMKSDGIHLDLKSNVTSSLDQNM